MSGCVIEIEPVFFDIFAVIALVARESKHSFFEDRVAAIPQRKGKHQQLVAIANAGDAIFSPAIGLAACHVVGEEFPRASIRTVIFSYAAPGTLADIGSPLAPGRDSFVRSLGQALVFRA